MQTSLSLVLLCVISSSLLTGCIETYRETVALIPQAESIDGLRAVHRIPPAALMSNWPSGHPGWYARSHESSRQGGSHGQVKNSSSTDGYIRVLDESSGVWNHLPCPVINQYEKVMI